MSNKRKLSTELRQAGAKPAETAGLVEVADQLNGLKSGGPAYSPANSRHRYNWVGLGVAAITGILLGSFLVAYSQTSLPGSWLYPAKRLSEKVAVAVDPNYRATLMMRRSQEVEELVGRHAGQPVILATLADYRIEAAAYKSGNYAAFEFCKNNLQQAANNATSAERAAINDTLSSLQA